MFFFGGGVDKVKLALNPLELTLMSYSHTMLPCLGEMWEVSPVVILVGYTGESK